ncbi:MAG: hypothetical protein FD189_2293 [Elusimicrobia bacterium]|nr:MAG: hypothetical protein FD154_2289 [Elusimicrobiota bacterium]KAF0153758.1 MAG: hypothetical protein FD189_2293 [Elusimicrobiota bacterium]
MGEGNRNWEFGSDEISVIEVETEEGRIVLRAEEGETVRVSLLDGEASAGCGIEAAASDGRLRLSARGTKRAFFFKRSCKTGFQVSAPAGKKLIVKTGSGAVEIGSFGAGGDVFSGAGPIRLSGFSGPLRVVTGAGKVEGEIFSENTDVKSGSAEIALSWGSSPAKGGVSIKSGSGPLALSFPEETRMRIRHVLGAGSFSSEFANDDTAPFSLNIIAGAGSVRIARKDGGSR